MKKSLLLLTLLAGLASIARAQVCIPDSSNFPAGAFAYPLSLPCITQDSAYTGTINFRIPDSIDAHVFDSLVPAGRYYLYVDSLILDSVKGMPTGITATINPGDTVEMYGGQYGCAVFSGTTNAATGNYVLSVYGNGCVHGSISGIPLDSCYSGLLPSYFTYMLSVCSPPFTGACMPDTANFGVGQFVYPAVLPCIPIGQPYSGTISLHVPDSIDAHDFYAQAPPNTYFAHVDSMKIDSITGLPAGISVVTYPVAGSPIYGGRYGCATFSGTDTDSSGTYPLGVYGRVCIHITVPIIGYIDTCISGDLSAFISYAVTVCGPPPCMADSSQFSPGTYVYPDTLPCIVTGQPYTGVISIEIPDSLDIHDFFNLIPAGFAKMYVDSIQISSITGYPAGITSSSFPVLGSWLYPNGYACAFVSGTTTAAAGVYPLTISGVGCGRARLPLLGTIDTCMTNNFTTEFPYHLSVCYPAGITEIPDGLSLSIYPSPNQGAFTVSIATSERMTGSLTVLDEIGRTVYTQSLDATGSRQIPLNLGNVSAGAYMLMINSGDKKSVKQFMVR